jgi:hypothetical protein
MQTSVRNLLALKIQVGVLFICFFCVLVVMTCTTAEELE